MKPDEKYKCGHGRDIVIIDNNIMSLIAYDEWKESTGFDGNKTQCWKCFCKSNG